MIFSSKILIRSSKMVDHEITATEIFSINEDISLPLEYIRKARRYSTGEEREEISKEWDALTTKFYRSTSLNNVKPLFTAKWDHIRIRERLSQITTELLIRSPDEYESTSAAQEIKVFEKDYKRVMETFLFQIDDFLLCVGKMHKRSIKSMQELQMISRRNAQVVVACSMANFAVVIGSLMQRIFRFSWTPNFYLHHTATGVLSFTISLLTISHMKRTTNDFSTDMSKERRLLLDLIKAHRKGDWVDEEVSQFFPYGINLDLIDKKAFEDRNYFKTKDLWKRYLCLTIILNNIRKDTKLLYDEDFLTRVKLFVENPAAEIWWSRIKVKKLLEEIRKKAEDSGKTFMSSHDDLIYRTAIYVYPVLIPWLVSSRTTEEMRFICTCLAGILAALDLGNEGSEELGRLRKMYQNFEKDIREIFKICEILDSSED